MPRRLKQLETALQKHSDQRHHFLRAPLRRPRQSGALDRLAQAADTIAPRCALYPEAQSALVGASQVALLQGDSDRAMEAVRMLQSIGDDPARGTDPWWHYRMGAGYKADPLWRETLAMMEAR